MSNDTDQTSKTSARKDCMGDQTTKRPEPGALRHLPPYWHTFNTFAKQRWYGRRILDVLVEEFRDRTKHYYVWAIRKGYLKINGQAVLPSHVLQNGDLITHTTHKHEPAVTSDPVRILHRDDAQGRLVVVKPGSFPVHSAGRYKYHTLLEIIKKDHDIEKVYTVNRLDRLTSGIMVAATNVEAAKKIGLAFEAGRVRKAYVCRVQGCFPEQETTCNVPLLSLDRQTGVVIGHPAGREAKTIFNRISYDAETDTSVLFCRPITGRTHQIRVHAQLLGHPIPNDPLYNHPIWAQHPATSLASIAVPSTSHLAEAEAGATANADAATCKFLCAHPVCAAIIESLKNAKDEGEDFSRLKDEARFAAWNQEQGWIDSETVSGINSQSTHAASSVHEEVADDGRGYCPDCFLPLVPDPPAESLYIYLHAIRYETEEWSYEDEMPWWARENWRQPDAAKIAAEQRANGQTVRPPQLKLLSESEGIQNSMIKAEAGNTNGTGSRAENDDPRWHGLLQLTSPSSTSASPAQMLMKFPIPGEKQKLSPDAPNQPAFEFDAPTVLESFRGIEDYALQELRTLLGPERAALADSIQTAVHSSYQIIPSSLCQLVVQNPLPFAKSRHIFLGSTSLPDHLCDQWITDRQALGTVKLRTKNRKAMKASKKAAKAAAGGATTAPTSNGDATGPPSASSSVAEKPSTPAVKRLEDGRVASEAALEDMITKLWRDSEATVAKSIKAWEQYMIKIGRLQPDQQWTFRTKVERSAYHFPTYITSEFERFLAECAWKTVNGAVLAEDDPPHPVSLKHADLVLELVFTPFLGCEPQYNYNSSDAPTIMRQGEEKLTLAQAWENNPPGSLMLMLKLDDAEDDPRLYAHRPEVDTDLTDGGTSFARFRAYTLASLLPLPIDQARAPTKAALKIWEPCVGTGSIAIELAEALRERGLSGEIFASDIEANDIDSARRISEMSQWPEGVSQSGVRITYKHLDLRDYRATAEWMGQECLDAIVTDLPWGRRVLGHGQLQVLYLEFVQACLALLKPYAYTVALTLEHKTLQRAVREAEGLMRRRGGKWRMQLEPLYLESADSTPTEQASVARQGARQARELDGVRLVEMGLRPFVCLLRKVPFEDVSTK